MASEVESEEETKEIVFVEHRIDDNGLDKVILREIRGYAVEVFF